MWVCSGSPLVAEICAGAGLDWLLIDAEHSPNGLESILAQLQAVHGYPVQALVRPPVNDTVRDQAVPGPRRAEPARAHGELRRGSRSRRGRHPVPAARRPRRRLGAGPRRALEPHPGLPRPRAETVSVTVQIESEAAVAAVEEILAVDGVDAIFLGPSDLAASMGVLGQQEHPEVRAAVEHCLAAAKAAGKPAGVNAFNKDTARATSPPAPRLCWWAPTSPSWPAAPKPSPPSTSRPAASRRARRRLTPASY